MDDSQLLDLAQWDQNDLDFRTPQLSVIESRTTSPAGQTPSQNYYRSGLPLLQLDDWDPDGAYDESPPTCLHYSIEWKLQLHKGRLLKLTNDTERDLVLAPGAFWDHTLRAKVDRLLTKKTPRGRCYIPEETIIVVSVTDRSERDLTKRSDEFNIDWGMVEEQLQDWSNLFRIGKKLRVDISFICKENIQVSRGLQGSRRSATTRQLAQREQLLESQEAAGQPRVWKDVYDRMRCSSNICQGNYCYVDQQRKHFLLDTAILTKMVEYAEAGNELGTHRDVPPYILDMIYEKERLTSERRLKRKASNLESDRPIKIVNVLPSPYGYPATESFTPPAPNCAAGSPLVASPTDFVIPIPIDKAVDKYTEWLCSQVEDEDWKAGFRRAGRITKADCLDLRHVYQDGDIAYYVEQGVKPGNALSFVRNIKMWADDQ